MAKAAKAKFLDCCFMSLFWLEGLWLLYTTLQNLIPSFPWIARALSLDCAPSALHPGALQGKEGINFCHLATLEEAARENRLRGEQRREPFSLISSDGRWPHARHEESDEAQVANERLSCGGVLTSVEHKSHSF